VDAESPASEAGGAATTAGARALRDGINGSHNHVDRIQVLLDFQRKRDPVSYGLAILVCTDGVRFWRVH
jgi:hypothetical protein